ncbi:hypothetical protein BJ165DRAFT_1526864 [Panaeolus papilionaceus]|nr:hypothetical protein BJ165DRAFT_1526864 [Panaeolus papilionaceus]
MFGRIAISAVFLLLWTAVTIPALPLPSGQQQREWSSYPTVSRPMMGPRNGRRFAATPTVKRDILNKFITNAQRLTNGLAPLPPAWKTFKGNKALKRRQGGPSPIPAPPLPTPSWEPYTGYFALRSETGDPVGYLDRTAKPFGLVGHNDTASESLRLRFWVRSGYTNTSYSTVRMENWDSGFGEAFPLLGLINGMSDNTTDTEDQEILARENDTKDHDVDSPVVLFLGGIEVPPDRSIITPQNLNNSFSHSTGIPREAEPNVWSIDIASGDVIAQWTDSHGHRIPTQIVLVNDTLVATNNITYLNSALTEFDQVTPVTLQFVTGVDGSET